MSIQEISQNRATQATLNDYEDFLTTLNSQLLDTGTAYDASTAASAAGAMAFAEVKLRDLRNTGLSGMYDTTSDDVATNYAALQSAVSAAKQGYDGYKAGSTSLSELDDLLDAVKTALSPVTSDLSAWSNRPAIQDNVFYNYSRAGEADLNNELGQLGDAMDDLNLVLRFTNKIDTVMSINPRDTSGESYVNAEGLLGNNFENSADLLDVAGSGNNALKYLQDAYGELNILKDGFASGSSVRDAIDEVLAILDSTYNISTMNVSDSNLDDLKPIWEDSTLRRKINDLLTSVSSQSDIEKQNLRKAMFIYQEFIKSSGSIMDRIFEAGRSIASRIAR